ncbi:unnamed protein product, partial [marine sediment metagenome]
ALKKGEVSIIREMAKEQEEKGASLLDVNVGMPGIDEDKTMKELIYFLSNISKLPLVIDSPNPDIVENALRIYPGRALINSISGDKAKLKKLLSIASKYGAMFILLPLGGREMPETAEKRIRIIKEIHKEAVKFGFTKNDFIVDGLTMTVSSSPRSAVETLKTIEWCKNTLKCGTVIGLSNISFGLPARKWINSTFLAMAAAKGLTSAIANPSIEELTNTKMAADVLLQKDKDAATYIRHFTAKNATTQKDLV